MIRNLITITILPVLFILLLQGCKPEKEQNSNTNGKDTVQGKDTNNIQLNSERKYSLNDFLKDDSLLDAKVTKIFTSLNDTERVGQMIMTSVGTKGRPFEIVKRLVLSKKAGGVILIGGNVESFKGYVTKLNEAVTDTKGLPLLYAIDAEPGYVKRFSNFTFPPQSKIKTEAESDSIARKISEILKEIGINMNFAPVCDISKNKDVIGERSFGLDHNYIKKLSLSFINRTQANNIIAVPKHFPGHGNTTGDSHEEKVYIDGELAELDIFKSVLSSANAVMVGHIIVRNNVEYQTNGLSSSLSPVIVTELIRNKLGYKGLILTDALNMKAATQFEKPSLKAALAGCDILLMSTDEQRAINSILSEMQSNPIFREQIYSSVKRIIKAKLCLNLRFTQN